MLNAANEVAVEAFLAGRLGFTGIATVIAHVLDAVAPRAADDLGAIMAADAEARRVAGDCVFARAA
jgi:1-deoxy-D-xylulose-5-phosphate reductoisomerase